LEAIVDLFGEAAVHDWTQFEEMALRQGYCSVAGVDEAGRGALAGPVIAAAVVFPRGTVIPGINDSKKLTPAQRDGLFDLIIEKALAVGVGSGDHLLVDRINILQATLSAMKEAVLNISPNPDYLIIDGIFKIPVNIHQRTIKKGDSASISIAAASIIAKVTRDRLMAGFECQYPGYGFAGHKGYGCAAHLEAIARLGPCLIHRKTFRGVREHVKGEG
jgi:ribonuclease HII